MRIYAYEFYACDEYVRESLKNNRERIMKKHGLKSLSFSFTLAESTGVEFAAKVDNDETRAVIETIKKLLEV